jgi:hypothetical protein
VERLDRSVRITSPTNDAFFAAPADIPITAIASNPGGYIHTLGLYDGTNQLAFYVLDPLVPGGGPATPQPLVVHYNWTNVPAGVYDLTATASDLRGMSATSSVVKVTVVQLVPPPVPVVSIAATDPIATPTQPGVFTVYNTGNTNNPFNVFYTIGGTASNGVDYVTLPGVLSIPAGAPSAQIIVSNLLTSSNPISSAAVKTVALTLTPSPGASPTTYLIGSPSNAVVALLGPAPTNVLPVVTIIATDPIAVEGTNPPIFTPPAPTPVIHFTNYCSGTNTATFLVRRFGPTNADLTVDYAIGGTASNGVDYVTLPGYVTIPTGSTFALITIVPLEDIDPTTTPFSTVILTLTVPPIPTNGPPAYTLGWPDKAGAIILEDPRFPGGPIPRPLAGGVFVANFPGTNGQIYCLEVSSDMVNWLPVCTNAVVKGAIQFVDPDAGSYTNRFYRTVPVSALPIY